MIVYILKSSACLIAFYLFYKLFLEGENIHVFKRWYLLLALPIAFGIPLVTFTYTIPAAALMSDTTQEIPLSAANMQTQEQTHYLSAVLWSIYGLGVAVFGILFMKNLTGMLFKIKQNTKIKTRWITTVLVRDSVLPHTFFNYIFLNKNKFEARQIPKEVIMHEEAHARQKHSLDVVCIEILQVIFWFNPLIYMLKRAIKLNHEFLADRAVISYGTHTAAYQQMLLAFSSNAKQHPLANAINYSLIKKRFTVMTKQTSKRAIGLRSLLLLPFLAVLLYGFSSKVAVPETGHSAIKEPLQHNNPLQDHVVVARENITVAKDIRIFVTKNGSLLVNNQPATLKNLERKLKALTRNFSARANTGRISAIIYADPSAKMKMISAVKDILKKHGISKITLGTIPPPPPVRAVSERIAVEEAPEVEEIVEIEAEELAEIEIEKAALIEELAEVEAERRAEARELAEIETEEEVEEVVEAPEIIEIEKNAEFEEAEIEIEELPEVVEVIEIKNDAKVIEVVEIPKASRIPPPPVSPTEHVRAMAKKGAVFYYEGKRISAAKAIQLVKSKRHINVSTKKSRSRQPVVHLSGKPIVIEK